MEIVKTVFSVDQPMFDEKLAAQYLGVLPGTLQVWRSTGRYSLPFVKVGRRVRYRRADLDAWLASRVHSETEKEKSA